MKIDTLGAIALLEEHGWCRSSWHNDSGQFCVAGACIEATLGSVKESYAPSDNYLKQRNRLLTVLDGAVPEEGYSSLVYNDQFIVNKDEAIEFLLTIPDVEF